MKTTREEKILRPGIYERAEEAYAAAKQRKWVGLTNDELEMLELKHAPPVHPEFVKDDDWWEFARAIEAKLKEKNA